MKRIPPIHLVLTLCLVLFSGLEVAAQLLSKKVYTVAEKQPEYPGGTIALSRYLAATIRVPGAVVRKNYALGPVAAKFIIDELGYVRDIRLTTKPLDKKTLQLTEGYMASIITAVEKMPRWQPGEVAGQPVSVFYTLPIEIHLH